MPSGTIIVTGAGGLIGSESVRHFAGVGFDIVGVENDMRARFFGPEASTRPTVERLAEELTSAFRWAELDIRDREGIERLVSEHAQRLEMIIHCAAQPSHDWAASDVHTDFTINANGTLNLLEAVRRTAPDTVFVHMSTNKVYGDRPNRLPLFEAETRLELPEDHEFYDGIPIAMSIDHCLHSVFGASKVAADLMVQEFGRYFDIPTVCFRGGCLTGPAHAGAKLHGFLSYLMKCTVTGAPYTIFGYGGKQVRDNIHSADVVHAFECFRRAPKVAAVYNMGGGRRSNVSMLEAISLCEEIAGCQLDYTLSDQARLGDHRWYISDFSDFEHAYPEYSPQWGIRSVLEDIHQANVERWSGVAGAG